MRKPVTKRRAGARAKTPFRRGARPDPRARGNARSTPPVKRKPTRAVLFAQAALAPAPALDSAQRKRLRALAHHLEPLVQVGHAGVTEQVVFAAQQALFEHELIKVRLHEPEDKRAMAADLAARTKAGLCGLLGHTVILFRPHPEHSRVVL